MLIRPPEARAVCCSRHLLSGTASLLALNARRNAAKHITTCCAIAPLLGSFRKGRPAPCSQVTFVELAMHGRGTASCTNKRQSLARLSPERAAQRPPGFCATGKGHRLRAKRHRLGPTKVSPSSEPPRRTGACAPGGARACAPALTRPRRRTARTMDGDVQYADYHWTTAVVNPIAIGRPLRMREITLPRLI